MTGWVCCQLGAREHYAVPRALHAAGRLRLLVTDAWVPPGSVRARLPGPSARRLSERYHADLAGAHVRDFTWPALAREAGWRLWGPDGWARILARNAWFSRRASRALAAVTPPPDGRVVVFAHAYSAREVFVRAKARGWTTVLGQIDPGEEHFRLVADLAEANPQYGPAPPPPPPEYFRAWRDECDLADRIVVNSEWSRELLDRAGIAASRTRVVPLLYADARSALPPPRAYPPAFTAARPLRVLYVGHVSVAKGAHLLLEAVGRMPDVPLELRLVGERTMRVPSGLPDDPRIRWVGPVARGEVTREYQACDVLVFPSLSDGFGMAQVEAQWHGLPVIASRSCGRVVADGATGLLLPEVSAAAIEAALRRAAAAPGDLARWAAQAAGRARPGLADLAAALVDLVPA